MAAGAVAAGAMTASALATGADAGGSMAIGCSGSGRRIGLCVPNQNLGPVYRRITGGGKSVAGGVVPFFFDGAGLTVFLGRPTGRRGFFLEIIVTDPVVRVEPVGVITNFFGRPTGFLFFDGAGTTNFLGRPTGLLFFCGERAGDFLGRPTGR